MRGSPLEIEKKILEILREGEKSLRELESRVNTNCKTIRNQIRELEFFGKIVVTKHKKNEVNGKPYTTVRIKSEKRCATAP